MNDSDLPARPSRFLGPDRTWHLAFGFALVCAVFAFICWSLGYLDGSQEITLAILTISFGVFMAFNIGGNDVANSFGTSVGAGTLTMKQALLVAAIFEVSGAVLAGGEVTDTVRSGIVDLTETSLAPLDFVFIMMAALLGAAIWLMVATMAGWPVSTTHSIIGGIVGASLAIGFATGAGGWEMVQWGQIGQIAVSWVLSPLLGGLVAFWLFGAVKRRVLVYNEEVDEKLAALHEQREALRRRHKAAFERLSELQKVTATHAMARDVVVFSDPTADVDDYESDYFRQLHRINSAAAEINAHRALETWVPLLAAGGSMVIGAMIIFKGFKNLHLDFGSLGNILVLGMTGAVVWMAVFILAKTLKKKALATSTFLMFSWMQVFTASAFAFSHGSNDIANAIGPFAAVLDVLRTGAIHPTSAVPSALMITCAVALVAGLWFVGRRVIHTVGTGLTTMHPASGFSAELAAASVVMVASFLGLPVSSTHILIGAVLGVGLVNRAANWRLMKPIALAWVITLPAAAGVSAGAALGLRALFGN